MSSLAPINQLIDRFGRSIDYLRLSVTDRCDFRCVYCMAEKMTFLPRHDVLSLEELAQVAQAFVELGVKKIRLTGGEPLLRRDLPWLIQKITAMPGLKEVSLTTNGSRLKMLAPTLFDAGLQRLNVSLDSLNAERFRQITRTGDLSAVLEGLEAAKRAGFNKIKLNAVILKGRNDDEITALADFACSHQHDLTFIEEMPLGVIDEHDRARSFMASADIVEILAQHYSLMPSTQTTGGPARYYEVAEKNSRFGFISPHSHNFCSSCNRVRVTVEGRLLLCLGNEHSVDLKKTLREYPGDLERLKALITAAIDLKPERHYFDLNEAPQIVRFMNATGG